MHKNRQDLLQLLTEKLARTVHEMNIGQSFSFGKILLGKQQIIALFFIYDNGGTASVKSLAEFLHVTRGAITQLVDNLVEKNFLKREEDEIDKRAINIKLKQGIGKKIEEFKKKYLIKAEPLFSGLTNEEVESLISLLGKINTSTKN